MARRKDRAKGSQKKTPAFSLVLQLFQARIPAYRTNPVLFAREVLHFEPDEWQREVLMSLVNNPRIAVKSGQGVGKTGIEAVALLWFLTCFPYPRVVATAPTRQQLHDVLWSEIAKWMARSDLLDMLLKWTKTYVYMRGFEKRWFAVARTATKPENMQGFHEDNMLFIVDEASGVSDPIMEAIKGTLSGKNNKLLLCGNPTKTSGTFYDAFHADYAIYKTYTVSSLDSPRTNKEMLRSMMKKYGEDSNFTRVRILGEFPKNEDDTFFRHDDLEANLRCESTTFEKNECGVWIQKSPVYRIDIGCDVARFGNDNTCIAYSVNEKCWIHKKVNGQDTSRTAHDLAALAMDLKTKYHFDGKVPVKIDETGVGSGVIDRLNEIIRNNPDEYSFIMVVPVQFGKRIKHRTCDDSTTYMMSVLREMTATKDKDGKPQEPDMILPDDPDLIAQLSTRKYRYTDRNRWRVESKDEYKAQHNGKSPDEADCILLVALPVKMK